MARSTGLGLADIFSPRHKIPDLRQAEAAECGLVAVAMVAWYHGQRHDIASLRRRFALSLKGATLKSLISIAQSLELSARALRIEPSAAKAQATLHFALGHEPFCRAHQSGSAWHHHHGPGLW